MEFGQTRDCKTKTCVKRNELYPQVGRKISCKLLNPDMFDNLTSLIKRDLYHLQVNIDTFPGPMVQTVVDSSRYFVVNPTEGPHLGECCNTSH